MKVFVTARIVSDARFPEEPTEGEVDVPDDTASFLEWASRWGRFSYTPAGQPRLGKVRDVPTIYFENDYD